MAKITKTYSIDEKLFRDFDAISYNKKLNKSSFIEEKIANYVLENTEIDYESYYMLKEPIVSQDNRDTFSRAEDMKKKSIFFDKDREKKISQLISDLNKVYDDVWLKNTASEEDKEKMVFAQQIMKELEEYNRPKEDVVNDVDVVKIIDKKVIKNAIYVELDNGNSIKFSDFQKMYEKCPSPDSFFAPRTESLSVVDFFFKLQIDENKYAIRNNQTSLPIIQRLKLNETYYFSFQYNEVREHHYEDYTSSKPCTIVQFSRIDSIPIFKVPIHMISDYIEQNANNYSEYKFKREIKSLSIRKYEPVDSLLIKDTKLPSYKELINFDINNHECSIERVNLQFNF